MQKLILLAGLLVAHLDAAISKTVVCYYDSALTQGSTTFDFSAIEVDLCSHLIFGSVEPVEVAVERFEIVPTPSEIGQFTDFSNLKASDPNLKTLLEIDLTSTSNSIFTATSTNRDVFIKSVITVLDVEQFDGVNILWVYDEAINQAGDKHEFTVLMQELEAALGKRMVTASVSGVIADIDESYEVPALADAVAFFNVMTFDLDRTPAVPGSFPNAEGAMQHWLSQGAQAGQLNMGIATYGVEAGSGGEITDIWAKYEVCSATESVHVDSDATIDAKADYIVVNNFHGAFVNSVALDDFIGSSCSEVAYPVIHRIKTKLTVIELP